MPQQFSVRLDDDTSAAFEAEAARRALSIADALRTAIMAFLARQQPDQLMIEVLRTRALLCRFIAKMTDDETAQSLVATSREDVEEYLKEQEPPQ